MLKQVSRDYDEAVYETDRDLALKVVRNAVRQGVLPEDIVFKVVLPCLEKTVKAISENDTANLAQHFMASQIAAAVVEEMTAKFKQVPPIRSGTLPDGAADAWAENGVAAGRVVNVLEGITDITERKQAEKELEASHLSRLTSTTSNSTAGPTTWPLRAISPSANCLRRSANRSSRSSSAGTMSL